jgi:hypothetical protein
MTTKLTRVTKTPLPKREPEPQMNTEKIELRADLPSPESILMRLAHSG